MAQVFNQCYGLHYDEVFVTVAKQSKRRILLAVVSRRGMSFTHPDVKTAYPHGNLHEEIYMRQLPGFIVIGKEKMVCRLRKSVYGLKQSARCWNNCIDSVLKQMGFQRGETDPCLYSKTVDGKRFYILIYVDDILIAYEDEGHAREINWELKNHFEITELGDLRSLLGMDIDIDIKEAKYSISLKGYIEPLTEKYNLMDSKPVKTPIDPGYAKNTGNSNLLENGSEYRS